MSRAGGRRRAFHLHLPSRVRSGAHAQTDRPTSRPRAPPLRAETHAREERSAHEAVAARLHRKLFLRLQSLVGRGGARALYRRSVKLVELDFPALAKVELGAADRPDLGVDLSRALANLEGDAIEENTVALTATVLSLLVRLIGEPLTLKVLRSEWPNVVVELDRGHHGHARPRQRAHHAVGRFAEVFAERGVDRLTQVLSNIGGNAIEHAAPDTSVVFAVRGDARRVLVEISNFGAPIDPAVLDLLFEPFRRAQGAPSRSGNLGLGLYIAREIVVAHGGMIDASSAEGKTTFRIVLPCGAS